MRHIGIVRLLAAAVALALVGSCSAILPTEPLSPARQLAGTWTSPAPIPINLQSSYCNDGRENVGKTTWNVTWIITEREGTSNGIDVEMRFTNSGFVRVASSCGSTTGWVPEPSPMFMQGTVSASSIQLYNLSTKAAFDGNLTTNNITGTFGLWSCQIYCAGEQSESQKFVMTKP